MFNYCEAFWNYESKVYNQAFGELVVKANRKLQKEKSKKIEHSENKLNIASFCKVEVE